MNETYDLSIVTHNYGVIGVLVVIFINAIMLLIAKDLTSYAKKIRLFMPIGITVIGTVIFTGIVMMASKHLDFSLANIVMIIIAIALIILENKRSSKLISLDKTQVKALENYKKQALNILLFEVFLILSVSAWMWK